MSKVSLGLLLVLLALFITRMAIYLNPSTQPGMTPEQIWYSMSAGLKAIVLLGFGCLVYGIWSVAKGALNRSTSER
jgi:hypothetical protein